MPTTEDDAPVSLLALVTNPDACLYKHRNWLRLWGSGGLLSVFLLSDGCLFDVNSLCALANSLNHVDSDDRDSVAQEALTVIASIAAANDPFAKRARVDAAQILVAHG